MAAANAGAQPAQQPAAAAEASPQNIQGGAAPAAVAPKSLALVPPDRAAPAATAAAAPAPAAPVLAGSEREPATVLSKDAVNDELRSQIAKLRKTSYKDPVLPLTVVSPNGTTRWLFEAGGGISVSTDRGATWRRQLPAGSLDLLAASSPSPQVCWAVGRAGVVLLTTDGEHWQPRPFPARVDILDVTATSRLAASVLTRDGRRFATTDGGAVWIPEMY